MPRKYDEKLKLLYILKILWEETDENHKITSSVIIEKLKKYEIEAERKSIYRDLDVLINFGFDIYKDRGGCCLYSRSFRQGELKMLVDAVQASKFVSEQKSNDIIKKIVSLSSKYGACELKRGVYVSNRAKSTENNVLYNIDNLHSAINANHTVSFKYTEWKPDKKKYPRHNGKIYAVSPWGLLWDDEKYYLLAFDEQYGGIKHYRVDKITDLKENNESRKGYEQYSKLDLGMYSKKVFGMFGGEDETVELEFEEDMAGVVFDRFGTDMTVYKLKNGKYMVSVPVKVSNNFLSWIVQFGGRIKITAPKRVQNKMKALLNKAAEDYQ